MRIGTLIYVVKQGIKSISRNKMFSLACIATMASCIFLFGVFFVVTANMMAFMQQAESGVAIQVFFDEGLSPERVFVIGERLRSRDDVGKVVYVSSDEAWEQFKHEYFGDNINLAEGFPNNPLEHSNNFEVYIQTTDGNRNNLTVRSRNLAETQQELVEYAQSLDGVRRVNRSDGLANALASFNMLVGYISAAIIIILFGVSIFLINNTVRMGVTVRKEEIAIMKYIGAKDFVVRAPFVIEGLLIGLMGAVVPLVLLYVSYGLAVNQVMYRWSIISNIIEFLPVTSIYRYLLPVGILLGVGIGYIGSSITVRKHLQV